MTVLRSQADQWRNIAIAFVIRGRWRISGCDEPLVSACMYVSRLSDLENARAAGFLKYVVKAPSGHIA